MTAGNNLIGLGQPHNQLTGIFYCDDGLEASGLGAIRCGYNVKALPVQFVQTQQQLLLDEHELLVSQ